MSIAHRVGAALVCCAVWSSLTTFVSAEQVNVYSARKEALIKPILDQFTAKHGIQVNLVTGKADALITRLASEGKHSPADVLVTTDVGRLQRAKAQNLLQSYQSKSLQQAIPQKLRDADQQWFALTLRARPIMYMPQRVDPAQLQGMAQLAEAQWRGRICIRSSNNIYNQSMVAAMLVDNSAAQVRQWAEGLVNNLARPPKGGDRDQIKAAVAGVCDIAIANTYYLAGMLRDTDPKNRKIAEQIRVFWPDQDGSGAHVNISGAAITKHAPNKGNGQKLLEFMITPEAQQWYAQTNHEYPVLAGVQWSDTLQSFGEFKAESIPLQRVGELNGEAVKVMDQAGWQ